MHTERLSIKSGAETALKGPRSSFKSNKTYNQSRYMNSAQNIIEYIKIEYIKVLKEELFLSRDSCSLFLSRVNNGPVSLIVPEFKKNKTKQNKTEWNGTEWNGMQNALKKNCKSQNCHHCQKHIGKMK